MQTAHGEAAAPTPAGAVHWPPRPPEGFVAPPLDLEALNRNLPRGWKCTEHGLYPGIPMYVHEMSRTILWARPIACDVLRPKTVPPAPPAPHDELERTLSDILPRAMADLASANAAAAAQCRPLQMEDRLEGDYNRTPREKPLRGVFHHEPMDDGHGRFVDPQLRFLRHFTSACLGAHADIAESRATSGEWAKPPKVVTCSVLGVEMAKTYHSNGRVGRKVVAEQALMKLCPLLWTEFCEKYGMRPCEPSIADPAVLDDLRVDDPRVHLLDECLCKSPRMMVQEYCAMHMGHCISRTTDRRVERDGMRQIEATMSAGAISATAIHPYAKTAADQAAINLLRKLRPHVELWRDMMQMHDDQLPHAGRPATVNGKSSFPRSAGLLLPSKSATAAALEKHDRMSARSKGMLAREAELKLRRAGTAGADADADAADADDDGDGDGDGDDAWGGRRVVAGEGKNFSMEWQRQAWVDAERAARQARGETVENDTAFAFQAEKKRDEDRGSRLDDLRAAFERFDAPSTEGHTSTSQGVATRYELEEEESASEWEPWKEGNRTYDVFLNIAQDTAGAIVPSARANTDMPRVVVTTQPMQAE
jgi:hypothetical protein